MKVFDIILHMIAYFSEKDFNIMYSSVSFLRLL